MGVALPPLEARPRGALASEVSDRSSGISGRPRLAADCAVSAGSSRSTWLAARARDRARARARAGARVRVRVMVRVRVRVRVIGSRLGLGLGSGLGLGLGLGLGHLP